MMVAWRWAWGYEPGSYRRRRRMHGFLHRWHVPTPVGDIRGWAVWNVYAIRFTVRANRRIPFGYVRSKGEVKQ